MYENLSYKITHRDATSNARSGLLQTPHGKIETPNFVFCATKGAMKSVTTQQVKSAGADIILCNTYHLFLQPGGNLVQKHGGLHKMLNWNGPMFTDSGGFQIFSLGHGGVTAEIKGKSSGVRPKTLLKIDEIGATFRSYIDGRTCLLTPEGSIKTQCQLGADIILALDECTPFHTNRLYTERSMNMSHRWELRSLVEFKKHDTSMQALYGIIQGGVYEDLRKTSAEFVNNNYFFGQAIGGSLGESKSQMHEIVHMTCQYVDNQKPTHLLGICGLGDIIHGITCGIDTFDCVHPTRLARHGGAILEPQHADGKEFINIKNSKFSEDLSPIDENCNCYCCKNFTKAYIHYLFKAKELLGGQLLAIHNIEFMSSFVKKIREAIKTGTFMDILKKWNIFR
ncbi:MAG: tRNA guanosine(34) transglycosylase Tgt [Puniceicoccales bacterium]|jgi:queuine tRNA-ribosyltransferase|nr:tRNA guanosine(34) transglycosylase Tgt [Puniceicoccales bacterium]